MISEVKKFCDAALEAVFQRLASQMRVETSAGSGEAQMRERSIADALSVVREIENVAELLAKGKSCECNRSQYDYTDGVWRMRVESWKYDCRRCGHSWITGGHEALPKRCPSCRSQRWNEAPKPRAKGKKPKQV